MPTPAKKEYILLGAILVIFCLYVPFRAGGQSQFFAFGIAVGAILGTARAVRRCRRENRALTRKVVWKNAAIASWIATALVGLMVGGPIIAAEGLGYALTMGSATAWGLALITSELSLGGLHTNAAA